MPRKPDPERIDADAPEATADWFERARPAAEVLPGLVGQNAADELLARRRGRAARHCVDASAIAPKAALASVHAGGRLGATFERARIRARPQ